MQSINHYIHPQNLKSLQRSQQLHNLRKCVDPALPDPAETQARTLIHLSQRTSWNTAVRIVRDVRNWRKKRANRSTRQRPLAAAAAAAAARKEKQGLVIMQQLVARPTAAPPPPSPVPSSSTAHSYDDELNSEIQLFLENHTRAPIESISKIQIVSYLHRLRVRDSPNINFVSAFQSILVDNKKATTCSLLQFTSIVAACFKKNNRHFKQLLELIFRCFETRWEGHPTGYLVITSIRKTHDCIDRTTTINACFFECQPN